MNIKSLIPPTIAVLLVAPQAYADSLSAKNFESLNKLLINAEQTIQNIAEIDKQSAALQQLKNLTYVCKTDPNIQNILQLSAQKCPIIFKKDYDKAVALKRNIEDAAKRLTMANIMQNSAIAEAYQNFIQEIKIDNPQIINNQEIHEGTPISAIANREKRMQWWLDGKIGMFIHYGLYSGMAGEHKGKVYNGCVEWIQDRAGLDTDSYLAEAMPLFVPKSGKAEEWVKLAKENGFCYTVLTSRHHEGFNMFDTKHSDFNVYKTKGVDIIKEYAAACEKYNIKAGYYLSMIDWNHPDYDPRGSGVAYPRGCWEMEKQGRRTFGNHAKYKEYLYNICNDLFSQYKVDLVWWDFSQPRFQGDYAWGATKLMNSLFTHHPMAIQNNRLYHSDNHAHEGGIKVTPHSKGDYSTAEHHIPGTGIPGDWEACQTLNGSWGYSKHNENWKSSTSLIHEIINTVSRGGNYLLNIGPEPDGSIPPKSIEIFKEIGAWLKINGEAIYGTRYNPLGMEMNWGRATQKGNSLTYLFAFSKPKNNKLIIPVLFEGSPKAFLIATNQELKISQDNTDHSTSIDVTDMIIDSAASVIRIEGKRIPRK